MKSTEYRDVALGAGASRDRLPGGRQFVVSIGIDRYAFWPLLRNAVHDAAVAHARFVALGFAPAAPPLIGDAATGDALRRLITDDLAGIGSRDSLVVFFAGHGHTHTQRFEDGTIDRVGYLIPVDGKPPGNGASSWVRVDAWLRDIARLPARHILVILDSCHSGIALASIDRARGSTEQALAALASRRSRRVMTSAHADEQAADGGVFPEHSLFTGALLEALGGGGDGGATTGAAIAVQVQRRVLELSESSQTPDFGRFVLDDGGDLVIDTGMADAPGAGLEVARPLASPLRGWLRRCPVVGDYLDGRAGPSQGRSQGPATAVLVLAGLGCLAAMRPLLVAIFGAGLAYLAWVATACAAVVWSLQLVCARNLATLRYRHPQWLRRVSKLVAVLAAAVCAQRLAAASLASDEIAIEGYVCSGEQPAPDAPVMLVDAAGEPASEPELTDRAGYIALTSARWRFRPLVVSISRRGCEPAVRSIDAPSAEGCSGATGIARQDSAGRWLPVWRVDPCGK